MITTFAKGTDMGPYEAARHIPGVSGHELSLAANRHFSIPTLNEAIADLVNAHARLDISQAWGDGSTVAADGTHMDTYLNNLLSETSMRYGKPGGIAYHHISDTYIALFTHFIPCGVWEAVYIIEGLLKNTSELKPATVHADTQGRSFPVFALAHLLGFDLMPRIRNWKDLTFYRTVQLLRCLSDTPLRRRVTAAANKVEAFNGFSQWIGFGNGGGYDPHLDVGFSPLRGDDRAGTDGYGQAA